MEPHDVSIFSMAINELFWWPFSSLLELLVVSPEGFVTPVQKGLRTEVLFATHHHQLHVLKTFCIVLEKWWHYFHWLRFGGWNWWNYWNSIISPQQIQVMLPDILDVSWSYKLLNILSMFWCYKCYVSKHVELQAWSAMNRQDVNKHLSSIIQEPMRSIPMERRKLSWWFFIVIFQQ